MPFSGGRVGPDFRRDDKPVGGSVGLDFRRDDKAFSSPRVEVVHAGRQDASGPDLVHHQEEAVAFFYRMSTAFRAVNNWECRVLLCEEAHVRQGP